MIRCATYENSLTIAETHKHDCSVHPQRKFVWRIIVAQLPIAQYVCMYVHMDVPVVVSISLGCLLLG
jgi:hypothetical protein